MTTRRASVLAMMRNETAEYHATNKVSCTVRPYSYLSPNCRTPGAHREERLCARRNRRRCEPSGEGHVQTGRWKRMEENTEVKAGCQALSGVVSASNEGPGQSSNRAAKVVSVASVKMAEHRSLTELPSTTPRRRGLHFGPHGPIGPPSCSDLRPLLRLVPLFLTLGMASSASDQPRLLSTSVLTCGWSCNAR